MKKSSTPDTVETKSQVETPTFSMSRRALLTSGAKAMPVVLTLQSGAALARSSNLISAAPTGTRDAEGNTLCLDTNTVMPMASGSQYDMGQPASGMVNVITNHEYYAEPNRSSTYYGGGVACERGGAHYYHDSGWREVNLPTNGIVVSATALVSVSSRGDIDFNRIG